MPATLVLQRRSTSRTRSRQHFNARLELSRLFWVAIGLCLIHQMIVLGSWTAPVQQTAFWAKATAIYGQRLSLHDKSVVEKVAKQVGVSPDRVILTLLYGTEVDADMSKVEGLTQEELDRLGRIADIQRYFDFHPGVRYRLTHRGFGRIGSLGTKDSEAISLLETNFTGHGAQ